MKFLFSFSSALLFVIFSFQTVAQVVRIDSTTNWKKSFRVGLNVSQASFTSNWKAGGVNSIGFTALLNYKANYRKGKTTWDNEIDLLYGMVNNQGQGYRKTLDRIYLDTKVGRDLSEKWTLFGSVNVLSQFTTGYRYADGKIDKDSAILISDFAAPAFLTTAWGFEYHPVKYFKVRLAPFAPRLTYVSDNNGRFADVDPLKPYGVEVGKSTRMEWLAFQMLAEFDKEIAKNLTLKWRYLMFANYQTFNLQEIDHRLDLVLNAKVNSFVNVTLGGILLYDFDQDNAAQIAQVFTLGVAYSFQNFEDKK